MFIKPIIHTILIEHHFFERFLEKYLEDSKILSTFAAENIILSQNKQNFKSKMNKMTTHAIMCRAVIRRS